MSNANKFRPKSSLSKKLIGNRLSSVSQSTGQTTTQGSFTVNDPTFAQLALNTSASPSMAETGPFIDGSVMDVLKGAVLNEVQAVSFLMQSTARRNDIPVSSISWYGHTISEDGLKKVIITQYVNLPVKETLAYRKVLFRSVAMWMATLMPSRTTLINKVIVVNVQWKSNVVTDQP